MSTTEIGKHAESIAADYLRQQGYQLVAQNWRTRWCEIDIVAKKQHTIYFVEVKYRQKTVWGDGLDAITSKKLQQMQFAAELWISQQAWKGSVALAALSMSGLPPQVDAFIELD